LLCGVALRGVTQLHDVIYVVCESSSAISRFSTTTHQRLTDIDVKHLRLPRDIAACQETSQLYITDCLTSDTEACIWRVSSNGEEVCRWWTKSSSETFEPLSLSVTATCLLVTPRDNNQLLQLDANGKELRRVRLPHEYMSPHHAAESPAGTFIVSHQNKHLNQRQVSEVSTTGDVLRQFSHSSLGGLGYAPHIAVDSEGNIFVADWTSRRILLLDAQLELRRVIDEHHLDDRPPYRLCYMQHTEQLLVGFEASGVVAVFDVLQ